LFHRLAPQHAWAALLHMGLTGQGRERFGYWAKVTKDRWFGRGQ
jgi:hypothetical protein